jgi:hypothetical protein
MVIGLFKIYKPVHHWLDAVVFKVPCLMIGLALPIPILYSADHESLNLNNELEQ